MATVITQASLGLDKRADLLDSEADYDQLPSTPAPDGTEDAPVVIDDEDDDDDDEAGEEHHEENEEKYDEAAEGEDDEGAGEEEEDEQDEGDEDEVVATGEGQQNGYHDEEEEEDFELLDDGAQELLNDYEKKHAAMVAGTDSTDELLLDAEDQDEGPFDVLPTVLIEFEGSLFDLFAQQASDGSGNSNMNAIPLKAPPEILDQPLSTLFSTVRIPDALGEFLEKETHILLRSPEVDLEIIETDPTAQQVLLQDFLDVHPSNANGDAVRLIFSQRQPFLSRFQALGGVVNTAPAPSLSPTTAVSSWMSRANAGIKRTRRGDEEADELDEDGGDADGVLGEHHEPDDGEGGREADWEDGEGDGEVHPHSEDGDDDGDEELEDEQDEPILVGDDEYEQEDPGAEDELGVEEEDGLQEQIVDLEHEDDALAHGDVLYTEDQAEDEAGEEELLGDEEPNEDDAAAADAGEEVSPPDASGVDGSDQAGGSSSVAPNGISELNDQAESTPTVPTTSLSNKRSFEETDGAEDAAGDDEGVKRIKV
ncbi:hypothetical protein OC846_001098 [Tilletia horrida]|uniref:Uncharacterized protein n=1 Tax=Tilletia horrida TaxID=155126 RepID=A0AAN6GUR4_9BASI|nr:hypothetical protein OC845_002279 [Tilletia horrida]KAK0556531.1 hypothetical protein OC846_001098 [Tilletia horrida]